MIGGNEANLSLLKQDPEAVKKVAALAHELGILIHVEGIPFGDSDKYLELTRGDYEPAPQGANG